MAQQQQQQLFEKVELRGEGDLLKIQKLLDEALDRRLQGAVEELTGEDQQSLLGASADFLAQLRQLIVLAEEEPTEGAADTMHTQFTPAAAVASLALQSPLLMPLSPPPVDAEVQQLEQKVTEASLRVAELRTSMQVRLQQELAAKLAACRPTADLEEPAVSAVQQQAVQAAVTGSAGDAHECHPTAGMSEAAQQQEQQPVAAAVQAGAEGPDGLQAMDTDGAERHQHTESPPAAALSSEQPPSETQEEPAAAAAAAPPEPIALSPQPMQLQQRLVQAASRMPALRARLEQAADKLQRVVAAVAADINRPPPNTVEKAVLGKTPGRPGATVQRVPGAAAGIENVPGVSPLFKEALESGQISTQRRVARDVQPVPYSQPE